MSLLYLLIGFIALIAGGEFLVRSSVGLSLKLDLSKMIIGLTVVSFATSAPELIVSIQGALMGSSGLALGNVIGSNIANIGIVLALTAVISSLAVDSDFFKFNWPWMMIFSLTLYGMLYIGLDITRWEGAGLLLLLVIFLVTLIRRARKKPKAVIDTDDIVESKWSKIVMFLILGALALWKGSEWLVTGAVDIATSLDIPESVIAVSMIAIGTSVPELAASIIAALKKEKAISLGNLIGSNIFNIGSVLGITSLIEPIKLSAQSTGLFTNDILWMLGFAILLAPLAFLPKKMQIGKFKGLLLVTAYGLFLYLAFSTL